MKNLYPAMVAFLLSFGLAERGFPQEAGGESKATRGLAILASGIGNDYPVEALVDFVEKGRFSPVIVDWAWITAHWDRTNFAEVNRFVEILTARNVEVAAMYRPRFIGEATVPTQVKTDGQPLDAERHEICYSSEEARRWGIAWGEMILEKCPRFDEIILYNPQDHCACPRCVAARETGRYATVLGFLAEVRAAWRVRKPEVKLGVVYVADPEFWEQGRPVVDVAYPFLFVTETADLEKDMAAVQAVREILKDQVRACLAKITWGPEDKVSPERLATFDRLARENGLPYFFWTFDTLFLSELYDPRAVSQALGLDYALLEEPLARIAQGVRLGPQEARALIVKIAETGDFAQLGELSRASDAAIEELIKIMEDRDAPTKHRTFAALGLGVTQSRQAAPALLKAVRDPDPGVRGSAAMSLIQCSDDVALVKQILTDLAENDPYEMQDPQTDRVVYPIRETAKGALANLPLKFLVPEALRGERIMIVQVQDFLRIENSGPALKDVEFERYFPVIDAEQFVVARWVSAQSDAGEALPVSIVQVVPDPQGNLIHTYRLSQFPEKQQVLVTITSLVARRERPAPQGEFSIPAPEAYPPEVRSFLAATPMVARDHPEIKQQAEELLAQTHDAYQVARKLAELMKAKSYLPRQTPDPNLPVAVSTLRYGDTCCASAVCAAAVLRACGIPTQLTYAPMGFIHGHVRFYLNGYGWVRMDSTCSVGKLPFVQTGEDLGMVRLFDMPIEMESLWYAFGWPYHHNDQQGEYRFRAEGQACDALRFAKKDKAMNSGSWNRVLGSEPNEGAWQAWDDLVEASRAAVIGGAMGEFQAVTGKLPGLEKHLIPFRNF